MEKGPFPSFLDLYETGLFNRFSILVDFLPVLLKKCEAY